MVSWQYSKQSGSSKANKFAGAVILRHIPLL